MRATGSGCVARSGGLAHAALLSVVLVAVPACKASGSGEAQPLRVAAAADLSFAFAEIGAAFEKKTGKQVTFSFGSTGLLAKQIEEGAPFDVFAAANISFVDEAVARGACFADEKALYARGRIVLWTRSGAAPALVADLAQPRYAKISIANPEHAPYGKAAVEAIQHAGVYDAVKPKLVFGENVQQALQFAQSGNADVAIVALSLASVSGGAQTPIPPSDHAPIDQALVVCKGERGRAARRADAHAFAAFVNSAEGRAVMRRFGFLLPGEAPGAR